MARSIKGIKGLMEKVYRERGFDFRDYRESTLVRRLERRLHARAAKNYTEYARVLDKDPGEYEKLFDDLTINVTGFFRDKVAFSALEKLAIPEIIKRRRKNKALNIWSAGCATGQEPYSVAMLLLERLGGEIKSWDINIIATDIDAKALGKAKEGCFPKNELEEIPYIQKKKYFIPEEGSFRIKPKVKKLVGFRVHNLVNDTPCQGLDLVVCRNVLIYFSLPLQMRVLRDFYQGLKRGGFLLLGKAEVPVGEGKVLFRCINKTAKLYKRGPVSEGVEEEGKETRRLAINVPGVTI